MSSPSVVCFGELIVDLYPVDGVLERHVGGSAANIAIGLRRHGVESEIWSRVGADDNGRFLLEAIKREGLSGGSISVDFEHPTRVAFVRLDEAGQPSFEIMNRDSADQYLALDLVDREALRRAQVLHISGTTLLGDVTFRTLLQLLDIATDAGLFISFDPNIRIVPRTEAWRRLGDVLGRVHLLKCNSGFLTRIWPGGSLPAIRREIGLQLLIVTDGANGARIVTRSADLTVPARPARIVDTTGAGDAWLAAFLHSLTDAPDRLFEADALRSWAETAARHAAAACEHRGAQSLA